MPVSPPLEVAAESQGRSRSAAVSPWEIAQVALERAAESGAKTILVWTYPAPVGDPLVWLSRLRDVRPRAYWRSRDGWECAGAGAVHSIRQSGPEAMRQAADEATRFLREQVIAGPAPAARRPRFLGGFSFDPLDQREARWRSDGFDDAVLVMPEALYIRHGHEADILFMIEADPRTGPDGILRGLKTLNERYWPPHDASDRPGDEFAASTFLRVALPDGERQPREHWDRAVDEILGGIGDGSLEKVVLARCCLLMNAENGESVDPWTVTSALRASDPGCFQFAFQFEGDSVFVGASPERLLRLTTDRVESECIAGTIGRGKTPAEDRQLAQQLLASTKDRREHACVVTAMREALRSVATDIDAPGQPEVLALASLQHLYSPIQARRVNGVQLGELLARLHPTPAVGGVPRELALDTIRKWESEPRGWYGGPVGWIGRDDAEFAVAIRSALISGPECLLYAGAGIVDGSHTEDEWRETGGKFQSFLNAVRRSAD